MGLGVPQCYKRTGSGMNEDQGYLFRFRRRLLSSSPSIYRLIMTLIPCVFCVNPAFNFFPFHCWNPLSCIAFSSAIVVSVILYPRKYIAAPQFARDLLPYIYLEICVIWWHIFVKFFLFLKLKRLFFSLWYNCYLRATFSAANWRTSP